ncbi:MAG: DUF4838 domain-containing protein [Gemmatimonadota bacterium]
MGQTRGVRGGAIGVLLCVMAITSTAGAAETVLVRDGRARAALVLPPEPSEDEALAAGELQVHLERMSGARLPVARGAEAVDGVPVLIGRAAPAEVVGRLAQEGADSASFRLRASADTVILAGRGGDGTLFAAYELLEQLGVRWCMPGELGTVIPKRATVAVALQDTLQNPAFALRDFANTVRYPEFRPWMRRMRLGGQYLGGHGFPFPADPQAEPELFIQVDGRPTSQLRVSHPEVMRRTIAACRQQLARQPGLAYVSLGPADGEGFGSDPWDAEDMDPLHDAVSVTDRLIHFYNRVLADLHRDYPEVGLAFYCYSDYMRPPVQEKPDPRILPVFAPIDCCRLHSLDNPMCWERGYIEPLVDGWLALGVRLSYRGYLFNLADPGLPLAMVQQVRAEFPFYFRKGMIGMAPEVHPAWSYHGPALYLAARMMWNPEVDADAVLADYFGAFYGPAAGPMRAHFDRLEEAYAGADYHAGNIFDLPHVLTPEVMADLEASLAAARAAVPAASVYARRVALTRVGFEFGRAQLDLMAALNAFDVITARELLERLQEEILPAAVAQEPPALDPVYGPGFTARFWEPPVREGYERVTGGNERAAALPDEWYVLLDPSENGDDLGLWRPGVGTGSWMRLKTYTASWSAQGLRYYKGSAWYRTTVPVEARFRGRPLRLWISGVDDEAAAWINGTPLPVLQRGAAPIGTGWEFDASGAVACGGENVVVVKVTNTNQELHELGTGGITGPAMLWAGSR